MFFSYNIMKGYYYIKISWKFEQDCSKNEGGDRFLVVSKIFAVLVCTSNKELVVGSDFDLLYLKN